uniref:biliverdin reductase A n=1 Tax=Myxine glutinosa TaxID=7769 RepID=UPI00358F42A1
MEGKLVTVVVVGVGVAGRVRIRDILNLEAIARKSGSPGLRIVGYVSRRSLGEIAGTRQITLPEALTSPDVQAAIISTENAAHEETVRLFLEAGKHVCVEYPLALSASAAQNLFKLADKMGRVLHIEHIELLTSQYKQLRDQVEGKTLEQGCLHFTGGPLMDFEKCGFPSFSGVSRLSWLVNLFGELEVEEATMQERREKQYFRLTAKLLTKSAGMLNWVEERGPGCTRAKRIQFQFAGGSSLEELPPATPGPEGLFLQDLHIFSSKLQAMAEGTVNVISSQAERCRILHCLELAGTIRNLCCGSPVAIERKSKTP